MELLEAFASTKPVEFDAFAANWAKNHPEPPSAETASILAPKRAKKK